MLRIILLVLFAFTGGLCLSGIAANLYRIMAKKPKSTPARVTYCVVMVVAGASVLLENATRSFKTRACSPAAYGFALMIAGYWALALGIVLIKTLS